MAHSDAFPVDWNEWQKEWGEWRTGYRYSNGRPRLNNASNRFPGRNMLADEVIGVYHLRVPGKGRQVVELSEVTFPDLGGKNDGRKRYIGITWQGRNQECINGGLVDNFTDLETALEKGMPDDQ